MTALFETMSLFDTESCSRMEESEVAAPINLFAFHLALHAHTFGHNDISLFRLTLVLRYLCVDQE